METPVTLQIEIWWWLGACNGPIGFNNVSTSLCSEKKADLWHFKGLLHLQGNPRDGEDGMR